MPPDAIATVAITGAAAPDVKIVGAIPAPTNTTPPAIAAIF